MAMSAITYKLRVTIWQLRCLCRQAWDQRPIRSCRSRSKRAFDVATQPGEAVSQIGFDWRTRPPLSVCLWA